MDNFDLKKYLTEGKLNENTSVSEKALDKIFDLFHNKLYGEFKFSHSESNKLTNLVKDLIEKGLYK